MMKSIMKTLTLLVFITAFAGCATDGGKKPGDGDAGLGAMDDGTVNGEQLVPTDASGRPLVTRVHFAFDSSAIDTDGRITLEAHATYLEANPAVKVKLEGHCDERGTREYNLALGERRAHSAVRIMTVLGIDRGRIDSTTYGEEKPLQEGHTEAAWKLNRRVEIIYQ